MIDKQHKQDQKWLEKGVDIWLIRDNLKATYEMRVERHQNTLNFIEALNKIGHLNRAKSAKASSISHPKLS